MILTTCRISVLGPRGGVKRVRVDAIATDAPGLVITPADATEGYCLIHARSGHAVSEVAVDVIGLLRMAREIADAQDWTRKAEDLIADRETYNRAAAKVRKAARGIVWTASTSAAAKAKSLEILGLKPGWRDALAAEDR